MKNIYYQNTSVSIKLVLYFQCSKSIYIILNSDIRLPHRLYNIIYTSNGTALKNKQKLNQHRLSVKSLYANLIQYQFALWNCCICYTIVTLVLLHGL